MVVYENFFRSVTIQCPIYGLKNFLTDNYKRAIYKPVRINTSSHKVIQDGGNARLNAPFEIVYWTIFD